MRTIAKLFGKSPFAPLLTHMQTVSKCLDKLTEVFRILETGDMEKVEKAVHALSKLEHDADLTKNDIRNHLPKSIFLPMDRGHLLEILSIQDNIADKAEDVGQLLTLHPLEKFDTFKEELFAFYKKNVEAFASTRTIVEEWDNLIESSFGGIEAERVKSMVDKSAFKEHEADKLQRNFLKKLFSESAQLSAPGFYLWIKLIQEIGNISNLSEKLANRIRMILELK